MTQPEVRVAAGALRGNDEDGIAVFRGIPFAEPPVGELRFAAPKPVRSWDGVRQAVAYGPPPPQAGYFGMEKLAHDDQDNWLTINVWTPALDAALPVMVWIQGGGYVVGMSSLPEYDGARLARDGVVVVTFNYRVGVEGFAHIDGVPANRALLDQVAALEWVRDNIRAFGGDSDQVTVFGESAGGGSVAALLAMPRAAGLFHRAIVQSMPGTFFTPELAADIAAELGPPDLSTVAPAELAAMGDALTAKLDQYPDRWGLAAHRSIPFAPVVDGDVLPVTPWQALADGAARDIPVIIGHTRDEQRLFNLIEGVLGQVTPEQAAAALEIYAPGHADEYRAITQDPNELHELVHSDWLLRMPSLHLAEAQIKGGGRVHLYELMWGGAIGACHGVDVALVFGNLDGNQPATLLGDPTEAQEVSGQMLKAWTDFAKTGEPGWPAHDTTQRLTRLFDPQPTVTAYPEEASRLIWQNHTFSALPLIGTE